MEASRKKRCLYVDFERALSLLFSGRSGYLQSQENSDTAKTAAGICRDKDKEGIKILQCCRGALMPCLRVI